MCRLFLSDLPLAIVLEEDITSPQSPMDKLSSRFLVLQPSHSSPKCSDPSFQKMLKRPYPWHSPRNSAKTCLESSKMWTQLLPKMCSKSPPFDQPSFHLKNIPNLSRMLLHTSKKQKKNKKKKILWISSFNMDGVLKIPCKTNQKRMRVKINKNHEIEN